MAKTKKYWRSINELRKDKNFEKNKHKEFAEHLPIDDEARLDVDKLSANRRDFLKMMGFGIAAVSLSSCEMPVKKAIPYLNKPEEITPGVANWYASTYADGQDYCSILVKTREGRPIKIEGNTLSDVTRGGVNARVHASVLNLYDNTRLRGPLMNGSKVEWANIDADIFQKLNTIKDKQGNIVILSSTILSPSTKKIIEDFIKTYPTAKHITYDAVSYSAITSSHQNCFEKTVLPNYRFDKSELVVSFGADFLGTWISPLQFAKQYAINRNPKNKNMLRHVQFESIMSLSGANADKRYTVKPSEEGLAILNLYNNIAKLAGTNTFDCDRISRLDGAIAEVADQLWRLKGKSLVISGSNDVAVQNLINAINSLLGNYGNTLDLDNYSNLCQGNDANMLELLNQMKSGSVDGMIFYNANPVYNHSFGKEFADALKKVRFKISFAEKEDETAALCDYNCPDHHYLEAWNDAEPQKGKFSLGQPVIKPIFKTRNAQESLLKWTLNDTDYLSYIKNYWSENLFKLQSTHLTFHSFWNQIVHDGVFQTEEIPTQAYPFNKDLTIVADAIKKHYTASGNKTDLVLYEKVGLGNGRNANNPWLQELPDPITRATWDNYLVVSPKYAEELGVKQEDVVEISAEGVSPVEVPVLIQPGQANQTVGLAVGYGRTKAGRVANGLGKNAYPFAALHNGTIHYHNFGVNIKKTDKKYALAQSQTQHTLVGRPIIKETNLTDYQNNAKAGNEDRDKLKEGLLTLYSEHKMEGHKWGMVIDLNSCIGCGACAVSCSAENNVPVVGKDEIIRNREMHWIRIDRYFSSDPSDDHSPEAENPEVVFQPMLCQHCDNAPCENVCPVAATNHSSEGLNQMAYNRCIGTRYCANNCPYKVRRFNWFDYANNDSFPMNDKALYTGVPDPWGMTEPLPRMALNPDVNVRSRGVMEKCTFCVQRIQDGKLTAKKETRDLKDGEVKSACQQSCPTNAIVFGDLNDKNSEVHNMFYNNERNYLVLEELHTLPKVGYLTKVRNT